MALGINCNVPVLIQPRHCWSLQMFQLITNGFPLSVFVCVCACVCVCGGGSCPEEVHTLTPNLPMGREDTVLTCEPRTLSSLLTGLQSHLLIQHTQIESSSTLSTTSPSPTTSISHLIAVGLTALFSGSNITALMLNECDLCVYLALALPQLLLKEK